LPDNIGYGAPRLCKVFSENKWNVNGLKHMIQKLTTLALSIDF